MESYTPFDTPLKKHQKAKTHRISLLDYTFTDPESLTRFPKDRYFFAHKVYEATKDPNLNLDKFLYNLPLEDLEYFYLEGFHEVEDKKLISNCIEAGLQLFKKPFTTARIENLYLTLFIFAILNPPCNKFIYKLSENKKDPEKSEQVYLLMKKLNDYYIIKKYTKKNACYYNRMFLKNKKKPWSVFRILNKWVKFQIDHEVQLYNKMYVNK